MFIFGIIIFTSFLFITIFPEVFLNVCANLVYRLKIKGKNILPRKGAGVIIANHVSFIDWLFVVIACRRKVWFIAYYKLFEIPLFGHFLKLLPLIPVAAQGENFEVYEKCFKKINTILDKGELICIFPEGKITYDGRVNKFRTGIIRILTENNVPLYAMTIKGLFGSFFSRKGGRAFSSIGKFYTTINISFHMITRTQWKHIDDLEQWFRQELDELSQEFH